MLSTTGKGDPRGSMIRLRIILATVAVTLACSPSAVAQPAPVLGINYGPSELDAYRSGTANAATVGLIHGGGWYGGSRSELSSIASQLQDAGAAVFNIDYELDGKHSPAFPKQPEDIEAAVDYMVAHAAEYGGDAGNIILIGFSAGGQLAAITTDRMDARTPGIISGTVTLSAPTDFPALLQSDRDGLLKDEFALHTPQALGCALETTCLQEPAVEASALWSPALQVPADCPGAWLIFNSNRELVPVDQPAAMTSALEARDCRVTTTILPGTKHASKYWSKVAATVTSFIAASEPAVRR